MWRSGSSGHLSLALDTRTPSTAEEISELIQDAARAGSTVQVSGGGTKLGWGPPVEADFELSLSGMDEVLEHNEGDLTAVLQAGVPLHRAQAKFAETSQMLALDPPLGERGEATIGGIVAAADQGPLRHRYGPVRDQLLGVTLVPADGSVVRSGSRVIKNVAGYDLAKLFCGSFGTLGVIADVIVRLHPAPRGPLTVVGRSDDVGSLATGASLLAHRLFEIEALDLFWDQGSGEVLALAAGGAPDKQAAVCAGAFSEAGLEVTTEEGRERWARQRSMQRAEEGAVVRVSGLAAELARVLQLARDVGASAVGRAGLGVSWLRLPEAPADELVGSIEEIRSALSPWPVMVLDAPEAVRAKVDVWGQQDKGVVELMRRVKQRFDGGGLFKPGYFVGGI
ncbi:FAD-binding oxidoreductase [soil metagenome]